MDFGCDFVCRVSCNVSNCFTEIEPEFVAFDCDALVLDDAVDAMEVFWPNGGTIDRNCSNLFMNVLLFPARISSSY